MAKQDYYEILGVERGADEKAIKKAYKRLAMKYHPDRTKGDKTSEEKFKEINEAYEILSDKEKRAAYDQYGHAAFEQGGFGGAGAGGFGGGFGGFGGFEDIFSEMFGGGSSRQRVVRGDDYATILKLRWKRLFVALPKIFRFKPWQLVIIVTVAAQKKDRK